MGEVDTAVPMRDIALPKFIYFKSEIIGIHREFIGRLNDKQPLLHARVRVVSYRI